MKACARGLGVLSWWVMIMLGTSHVGSSIGNARISLDAGMKLKIERGIKVTHFPVASRRSRRLMEPVRRRGAGISSPCASNARASGDGAVDSASEVIQDSSVRSASAIFRR